MKMEEITGTIVKPGTVALWWMGQMGLILKSENTIISIDYFASPTEERQVQPPVPAEQVTGIDAFLGTHDHLDHIDHEAWKIWKETCPEARFVFPRAHEKAVAADGISGEIALGINAGESVQIGDFTIHAIPAAHEFLDRDERSGLYPYLQYIVECGDIKIYHAGDTVRYEGMLAAVKEFGTVDLALLPINGRDAGKYARNCIGNMTYQEAADFAGEIGTKVIIPGHFDMFADNSEDPEKFKAYIDVKYPGKLICRIPTVMEKIVLES